MNIFIPVKGEPFLEKERQGVSIMHHHGEIIAIYRKARNLTQEDLAKDLHVTLRTVQKMEANEHIRNINRRWFLVGLLGIPAIELDLSGPPPWSKKTALSVNTDTMNFFESELALHWKLYKSAGPAVAASTLPAWMKQIRTFQNQARGTAWEKRAGTLLSMSHQLDGSIKRELKDTAGALTAYQQSYTLAQEIGNVEMQASTLLRHGRALALTRSNQKEALPYYHQALKLVEGKSFPILRGGALQNTAEAYARLKQPNECWRAIDLAEHIIGREEESRENNYSSFNKATIDIYKGSYALYLGDYERAIMLFDKGLNGMRHDTHMHSRFMVRKARALYHAGRLDECVSVIMDTHQLGENTLIMEDIRALHTELLASRYKKEGSVKRLGSLLSV